MSPKQQLNLSPPQVQRCMSGVEPLLSHIKTPEPLTSNVKPDLVKLTEDLVGDAQFTERLIRIIQMTNTASKNKLPGGMSLSELRLLKLEKFLEEEKAELRGDPKLVAKLRPVTLCEEESEVITQSPPTQGKDHPVKPQKVNLKNKPKELFVKKLLKNQREKNNTMLVHGVEPPNPIPLFCRTPFSESMVTKLESSLRYRGPRSIQSYTWPAILDKRSLVALSPTSGGKTLAYVAPIVTMLQRRSVAPRTGKLNPIQAAFITLRSPSVVVLCSTWRKVQSVTDMFDMFMSDRDKEGQQPHRVIGITGGPEVEDERSVDLILGCSVLVCSPYTLIRICRNKSVDLTRLEQLVVDDIHTLVEAFTEQVGTIMRMWMEVLRDPDRPNIQGFKPQVLGFGIQWTTGVKSFIKTFMNNQSLLYISHPLEASVFGRVQHHTIITSNTSSYNSLLSLIQHYEDIRAGGVAVYVKDISTLTALAQALTASSIHCVTAHACMEDAEIQQILELFTDASNSPVLVLTDDVIPYLDIDSIQITIHYNFPSNKHDFGLRLSLMSSFYHPTIDKDKKIIECCSYMFFSEDNATRSVGFVKFLNRIKQPISVVLKELAVQSIEVHETSKQDLLLCPFFQAYGACRDINVCGYRHVISSLDKPNVGTKYSQVPTSGHVRVKVTCIVNATRYYARLMKHRDTISGVVRNIEGSFQEISKDLLQHLSTPRTPCLEIKRGKLICVKLDNMFYRVVPMLQESCDDVKWQTVVGVYKARVRLVDVGTQAVVNVENLFELPQHLVDIPYQAIEVCACCVKPLDNDIEWLMQANELVHNLIFDKEIEGNIVLALGHTIWLKPVVIRSKLPKTGVVVTDCDIIEELVSSGLAVKNTDHVKCLLEASSNKIIEITENASNMADLKTENETNFEELEVFENENLKKNLDSKKLCQKENVSKPEGLKYASPSPSHAVMEDKSVASNAVSQMNAQVPDSTVKCGGSPHKELEMAKKEKKAHTEKVDKVEALSALQQKKSPNQHNRAMGNSFRVAKQEMPCSVNGIKSHMKKVENVTVIPVNGERHESDHEKRLHRSKSGKLVII
ncbi:putative ATP-dependent RNA helicase TDRD12 [Ciona intestinalis]